MTPTSSQGPRSSPALSRVPVFGALAVVLAVVAVLLAYRAAGVGNEEAELTIEVRVADPATQTTREETVDVVCDPLRLRDDETGGFDWVVGADGGRSMSAAYEPDVSRVCAASRADAAARVGVFAAGAVGLGVLAVIALGAQAVLLWRRRATRLTPQG